jgi:nucleoside-diphosphate kinase
MERTLSIIKPDAVGNNLIGNVISYLEKANLKIIGAKMLHLSTAQAKDFYAVHKERPFFNDLVSFISSGPVLVLALEGRNAVQANRDIMGATNPKDAKEGTIRKNFAKSIDENAVHGSDSTENAKTEIAFFFKEQELCARTR